jgi:hypothetical protein
MEKENERYDDILKVIMAKEVTVEIMKQNN